MASQITGVSIVSSTVGSDADKKDQSSESLAFVRGIHRWPVNSPHKGPVTRKMFLFDDVIMPLSCFTHHNAYKYPRGFLSYCTPTHWCNFCSPRVIIVDLIKGISYAVRNVDTKPGVLTSEHQKNHCWPTCYDISLVFNWYTECSDLTRLMIKSEYSEKWNQYHGCRNPNVLCLQVITSHIVDDTG